MEKMSKMYVAGHEGLVGSAIVRKLKENGYRNILQRTRKELDLRNQGDIEKFFEQEKPEYVFLAAAKVGGILANSSYKAEFIYDNMMISANVIHSAYTHRVRKLLNLGSSCIYPRLAPQPIKEESLLTGSLEPTNEPYAISKISAIKLCKYYNEQYGTDFISAMPTNLYGHHDNFNLETAHAIPALIRKFHLARLLQSSDYASIEKDIKTRRIGFGLDKKIDTKDRVSVDDNLGLIGIAKDSVILWGSGKPFREFLFVDDLADACVFLMERYDYKDIGEIINIGTGEDLAVNDIAKIVKNVTGFEGGIKYDSSKPDGAPRKLLDISRIKALGWSPKVDLREGIKKEYQWDLENTR
jgi:GDP-L-fucose synthase